MKPPRRSDKSEPTKLNSLQPILDTTLRYGSLLRTTPSGNSARVWYLLQTVCNVRFLINQCRLLKTLLSFHLFSNQGERFFGRPARRNRAFAVKVVIVITVLSSIVIAAIATPSYRVFHSSYFLFAILMLTKIGCAGRQYYASHGVLRQSWFDLSEVALALVFIFEFGIKVIADGC